MNKIKVLYDSWHNNYEELNLGEIYEAILYKKGWLLIETNYNEKALYREECFKVI